MTVTRSAAAADSPCYSVRPFVLRGSKAGGRPCWTWLPSRCGFRSTCTTIVCFATRRLRKDLTSLQKWAAKPL